MARNRKSRDQKIKADSRHKEYHLSAIYTEKVPQTKAVEIENFIPSSTVRALPINNHLKKDLIRTISITGFILAFQLISLLILHHRSIVLFGAKISY